MNTVSEKNGTRLLYKEQCKHLLVQSAQMLPTTWIAVQMCGIDIGVRLVMRGTARPTKFDATLYRSRVRSAPGF